MPELTEQDSSEESLPETGMIGASDLFPKGRAMPAVVCRGVVRGKLFVLYHQKQWGLHFGILYHVYLGRTVLQLAGAAPGPGILDHSQLAFDAPVRQYCKKYHCIW